jgi:hypothetical protein
MAEPDLISIVKAIVERMNDPIALGWTAVGIVFVWKLADIIRAVGEVIRLGRSNKAEIARKQALLKEELATKIARRRSHELRKEP